MTNKPTYEGLLKRCKEYEKAIQEFREKKTQHEQREAQLLEDRERYRALIENANEIIAITDEQGFISTVNKKVEEVSGYSRDELIGETVLKIAHPEDKDRYVRFWKDTLEGLRPNYELKAITKSGDVRYLLVSGSLIERSGKRFEIQCNVKDITDLKRVEEELRESEERYRTILDEIDEGYFEFDLTGKFTFVSDWFLRLAGDSIDALLKMTNRDYMTPDSSKKIYRIFTELFQTGKPVKNVVYEIITTKGEKRIHELSASLMRDKEGSPVGFRGTTRDVTDRVKSEEERQRLLEKLSQVQKMEAIGTLAGGVAHDLNNILAGLVSVPDLLLVEIPEESPLRKPVLTIQKSGKKAATMVQDLLTLARRGVAVTEVVNLNDILSEFFKSPEYRLLNLHHPGAEVETRLETDLLNVTGSPVHLSKVVMNLVSNAAEAVSDMGKIIVSTENRYIDTPIKGYDNVEEGDYAVLKVSDTGIGISPEDMEKIGVSVKEELEK